MSRFNVGSGRMIGPDGRFKKVSQSELDRLKEMTEADGMGFPSPSNASCATEAIPARYFEEIFAESPAQTNCGSDKEEEEIDSQAGLKPSNHLEKGTNPTLQRLMEKRGSRLGQMSEIDQLVNGADLELFEPQLFFSMKQEYHSMGTMLEPLRKWNKAIDVLCKDFQEQVVRLAGSEVSGKIEEFVLQFMSLLNCGTYAAIAAMMKMLSQWGSKDHEGSKRFTLSRKVMKIWREYAFAVTGQEIVSGR